jgi:TldD protein
MRRRQLLIGGSAAALAAACRTPTTTPVPSPSPAPSAPGEAELLRPVLERALAAARAAGASYADARVVRRRFERIATREDHVVEVDADETFGLGVRVLAGGAWGFAASVVVTEEEATRVAEQAVAIAKVNAAILARPVTLAPVPAYTDRWGTTLREDPLAVPLAEKAELLLAVWREASQVAGVKYVNAWSEVIAEWKVFASTEGSWLEQSVTRVWPGYKVTAVDAATGEFESVNHTCPPMQAGWEFVKDARLVEQAREVAENTVRKLRSPSVTPGKRDLVLAPSHLWLTIHESVGHPTELDRALGYEANFAGTSFATPDQIGKLKYANPIVTLYADKTTPGGLATSGYDDDGVKTQRWDIVKDGVLVGFQTTRDQAGWIGEKTSRGTSFAMDHRSFPFQRMPNLSLAPGAKDLAQDDLVAATDDGILIVGNGSFSIDQQRYNFQFGGQMFYAIKGGKIAGTLRDVAYQANTVEFWNSCDLIAGEKAWELHGTMHDGKGQPSQSNPVSHGCPPARFRAVNVLNTNARGRA